ncbi:MAG: cytochrome bc complex cytochrome b subunit [Candidatus Aminicenantes bacterium]|nr:cytochrome bc complex cytochrome b subunit [Candidatus Aminicenantes bacterium]
MIAGGRWTAFRRWLDERLGFEAVLGFMRRKTVPKSGHTVWMYTGSAILIFFAIQVVTGVILAFYYRPTLEEANASVARIVTDVPLGWVVRSIHSWSATFMITFVFIHLVGIWLLKSYRKPRELTWMSGVLLLFCSLFFGFTGYLLPWDALSLSATKVGTDIPRAVPVVGDFVTKLLRGGDDVSGETLSRFFSIHVSVLPLALLAVLALHVFLIQKLGMSLPLEAEVKKKRLPEIPFWPNFVYREAIVWLVLFGALLSVAVFLPPGLGAAADLRAPAPEGIKPEWYFLFLFQTLKIFPPKIWFLQGETVAVLAILAGVLFFFFIPLIDNKPASRKGKVLTAVAWLFIVYALAMSAWSLAGPKPAAEAAGAAHELAAGPQSAGERTGIYVFLAWTWATIVFLVFVMRVKVREVDALHAVGYFREKNGPAKE